jgi:molecular chaperone GrpE (heat shock protein)
MARNISKEGLEQKIEKVEKAVSRNREQYDRLTAELEELHKKQKALQSEELLKAISESSRSYEEILEFIQTKAESNDNE